MTRGFSLIEMLAALTILALAGLAVLNLMQVSTQNAAALESRSLAMLAAENVINREILSPGPIEADTGSYELAGLRYDWALRVENTTDSDLVRLVLTVTAEDSEAVLAQVETFRRRSR